MHSNMPKSAPVHPWDGTKDPWDHLHIDFAGPFMNSVFLIIVDAHSKWLVIFLMKQQQHQILLKITHFIFSTWSAQGDSV